MLTQRWSRFIPSRPRLALLLGLMALVAVLFVLTDLALTKSNMMARYLRAEATVEQLTRQKSELQHELERAQQGQHLPQQAFEQFGMAPPQVGIIVGQGEKASSQPTAEAQVPFWVKWWRSLGNP